MNNLGNGRLRRKQRLPKKFNKEKIKWPSTIRNGISSVSFNETALSKLTGSISYLHISKILFTQDSARHSFNNKRFTITNNVIKIWTTKILENHKNKYNIHQLKRILNIPDLTLDVIFEYPIENVYSCNNRRLCLLKLLYALDLFDGIVKVNFTNNCEHFTKCHKKQTDCKNTRITNFHNKLTGIKEVFCMKDILKLFKELIKHPYLIGKHYNKLESIINDLYGNEINEIIKTRMMQNTPRSIKNIVAL